MKTKTNRHPARLSHTATCPQCGAVCEVDHVYKDRTTRFHHFDCACGRHFAEAWRLYWPDRWVRLGED